MLALFILTPLRFVLTPRWFHKINVAAVRALNAPLLLLIGLIERRTLWASTKPELPKLPKTRSRPSLWDFSRGFSVHGDIQAVFETDPPESTPAQSPSDQEADHDVFEDAFVREFGPEAAPSRSRRGTGKSRRDSVVPYGVLGSFPREGLGEIKEDSEERSTLSRLKALEKATSRIEEMLAKLCDGLGDSQSDNRTTKGSKTSADFDNRET